MSDQPIYDKTAQGFSSVRVPSLPAVPVPHTKEEAANEKLAEKYADGFYQKHEELYWRLYGAHMNGQRVGASHARSTWEAERDDLVGALKKWALSDTVMEIYRDYPDDHTLYGWQLGDYRRVREALSRSKERP